MNVYLVISGILTILMAIAHTVMGEILILIPLQKTQGLPAIMGSVRTTRETLRFAWHVTSVLGIGIAFIFFYYASFTQFNLEQIYILRTLSVTFLASFVVAIIGSRAKHPSWIVFIVVSILIWLSTN
ncbi:MAG: hypothetical protein AB1489_34030 [Acidobacteriota bacterium]